MNIHKLQGFFSPQRIAVVDVSMNPQSVSGKVLSNLIGGTFRGVVYPVNNQLEAVLGVPCYQTVSLLPKKVDLAVICSKPEIVPQRVKECGESGIMNIIIMSAGFREVGEQGKKLEEEILTIKSEYPDMRILGPNCLGVIVPALNLNVSFAGTLPTNGNIAFVSQSGALGTSILDWANEKKIGFSYFVSIGNAIDVDFADMIDFFGEDEKTQSIVLYIESIKDVKKFVSAARSFARTKPIVAYKAGRFPQSAAVASSHTGALTTEDAIYDAVFKRTGIARVYDVGEIFNVTELIGRNRIPSGPRLAILTNAGGPAVIATDILCELNGKLATLSEQTIESLKKNLPPSASVKNPIDVLGDAPSKRILKAAEILIADENVDALLVIVTPQAMTNPTNIAKGISQLYQTTSKPIIGAWLGGEKIRQGIRVLAEAGVPAYVTPEEAVRAFMTLVSYSQNLESLYETPREIPIHFTIERKTIKDGFLQSLSPQSSFVGEIASKQLLCSYGIPVNTTFNTTNVEEAVKIAAEIGYPVVLKVNSSQIIHKTDVGGVALDIKTEAELRNSYQKIIEHVTSIIPPSSIDGITIQRMIKFKNSIELILGIKKDRIFGTIIMVGLGGIYAEVLKDTVIGFPPLNEKLSHQMLQSLRAYPLLKGYRGLPAVNIDKLIEVLIRMSYLASDYPQILELDINPFLLSGENMIALDARVIIDTKMLNTEIEPYSHLAFRPYPEDLIKQIVLPDGTPVLLRPIKPEDEPLWMQLLASCSRESIYSRFRYFFHWESHQVAVRYCYIDYNREIAIVAEVEEKGLRKLVAVGRLIADPDHETAEYAVLVADAWQNRDLGGILTDYCFEIAKRWKVKRMVAQTTTDNSRMIAVFQKRNFNIEIDYNSTLVEVSKEISR